MRTICCRLAAWRPGSLAVAGLLAQRLGVADLVDRLVTAGVSGSAKALTVIGAALAGGDCIDDVDVLRAGAAPRLFDDVRAPSTVGTWLRSFAWASVRQLDRVTRELLRRAWAAGLGPDLDADLTIDIDSTVVADGAIVFALANPVPEIMPERVPGNVAVIATVRSDLPNQINYPNQINNALVFPGFFRGLLDSRAPPR